MKRKTLVLILLTVALFYSIIFILSRGWNPLFFMGTGWRFYKLEDKRIVEEVKIGELNDEESVFIKNVKLYPECSGSLLHEDLKEKLLSFSFDSYLFIPVRMIIPDAKEGDSIFIEVEEEVIIGDAINYIFNLPVRIERIKLIKPIKIKEVRVRR